MKPTQCQTCGKMLTDQSELYMINNRKECEQCAAINLKRRQQGLPMINNANHTDPSKMPANAAFSFNSSEKSSIVFLKVCAFIQLFANVILSFYMGEFFTIPSDFEFLIVIVSLIVSIVIFAIEYVFLGMASDMNVNKEATVKLLSTQIEIINTLKAASAQNQAPQQNAAPLDQQYPPQQNSASPIQQNPPQQNSASPIQQNPPQQ